MAKVRYGKFTVEFDSEDELDSFLARHDSEEPTRESAGRSRPNSVPAPGANGQTGRDQTLLRKLIQAGSTGIEAGTVAALLGGPKGRGVPTAVRAWATRVGLADSEDDSGACQSVMIGRSRGWRLSAGALGAAKAMTEGQS
jgi:hypothetical protein